MAAMMPAGTRIELQKAYDRFASKFPLPLISGGEMEIGDPIGPGAIDHFVHAVPTDSSVMEEIWKALRVQVADVYEGTPRWTPGPDEVRLAVALHNLVYTTHPDLDRALGRRACKEVVGWTTDILDAVAPPATVEAAVLRHVVVGRFDDLARRDVTVSTWAYRYRFAGRAPPKRFLTMPRLRRVRTHVSHVPFYDLRMNADAAALLESLLRRTPLTAALRPTLPFPAFRWHPEIVHVLQDVSLCRSATYAWVEVWDEIPKVAGAALAALARAGTDLPQLAFVVCFHYNLVLTFAYVWGTETAERLSARPASGAGEALLYGTLFAAIQAMDRLRAPKLPMPDSEYAEVLQSFARAAGNEGLAEGRRLVETASSGIRADAVEAGR